MEPSYKQLLYQHSWQRVIYFCNIFVFFSIFWHAQINTFRFLLAGKATMEISSFFFNVSMVLRQQTSPMSLLIQLHMPLIFVFCYYFFCFCFSRSVHPLCFICSNSNRTIHTSDATNAPSVLTILSTRMFSLTSKTIPTL